MSTAVGGHERDAPAGELERSLAGGPWRLMLLSVALVSAAVIAYEIVLMRRLLIERWHHFGYLVISVALLGFGASGTLLALVQRHVRRRPIAFLWWLTVVLLIALAALPRVGGALPLTARVIPGELWTQMRWWLLYWAVAAVPFLIGGLIVGAALTISGTRVGRAYAMNLFGSSVGAVAGGLLISRFPAETMLWPSLALVFAGVIALTRAAANPRRVLRSLVVVVLALVVLGIEAFWPARLTYDEFKYAARVRDLAAQGQAERLAAAADPHGYVEVYASPLFHSLPFLALHRAPPPMLSVLINGNPAGSILRIDSRAEAAVMDSTLMAVPYELLAESPRVMLIGETGGANVWLARRQDARGITVVQPNAALTRLLRVELRRESGGVFVGDDLNVITEDPRAFLGSGESTYDLIQVVSLEGLGLGAAGLRGLAEDHLVTVQGIAACLRHLDERGIVSVCRGVQTPPRENIRILATFVAALESLGVTEPARHIVQVRDYLGVCTLALKTPLGDARRAELRAAMAAFQLTPTWYAGIAPEEVNRPDALPGPPGSDVDWLHHAARKIFSAERDDFFATWLTDVRPPTDDRPFFWDFYKPGAAGVLREAYGPLWLARAELGRLFLYASLGISVAAAILLILLPLGVAGLRRGGGAGLARVPRRLVMRASAGTVLYFGAIGLAFMGIEMALISRAIRVLGDPVVASAAVIGGVLLMSGVGSLTGSGSGLRSRLVRRLWAPPVLVALLAAALGAVAWSPLVDIAGGVLLALVAGVVAFCMGLPMPSGLAALDKQAPGLVPWAWATNGVASVASTSLALVIAMTSGYRTVFWLAAAAYLVAALAAATLLHRSGDKLRAAEA